MCGLSKNDHVNSNQNEDQDWSIENNTENDGLTDSYGEIFFRNFSEYSENKAQVNKTEI